MNKKLNDFLQSHQDFLRKCSRYNFGIFSSNDERQEENEESVIEAKIQNEQINFELDDEEHLETATNYAFEILLDENSNDKDTIQALSLLIDIICKLRRNTNSFLREEIITSIIDLLYHSNEEIVILTLKLINVLTQGSRDPIKLLIKNNLLSVLMELIDQSINNEQENFSILHLVIYISSNIASLSSKKVHLLIEFGFHNLISIGINRGNINSQLAVAFLISNIMIKGYKDDIENTINLLAIDHLFQFLDEDYEPHFFHCILDGMLNCLQNNICIEKVLFENILRNEKYFNIILKLLTNEDEYNSEIAQSIICKIKEE